MAKCSTQSYTLGLLFWGLAGVRSDLNNIIIVVIILLSIYFVEGIYSFELPEVPGLALIRSKWKEL